MHSSRLKKILTYEQCIDLKQFCSIAKKFDMLIAPDRGAIPLVKQIGASMKLPTAFMKKIRIRDNKVKIAATNGNVRGKNLLIVEDMICTGSTIITASKKLLKQGAKSVCVLATHGVFSQNALKKLESSPIQTIYVTNSIKQKKSQKLKILDISPYIREEISKA
jgi:ribose-phosphate pyrophosphokinase